MSVSRIQELNIDSRPLVTGIYGLSATNEFYVDKDLCRYHLWQELYLYMHENGYITVFYNIADNLFSYQERDLALFFRRIEASDEKHRQKSQTQASPHRRHPRCRGPLGFAHPNNSPASSNASDLSTLPSSVQHDEEQNNATELQSHYPDIMVGGDRTRGKFYQTKRNMPDLFDRCFRYADDYPERKLAVVFTTPESSEIDTRQYATVIAKIKPLILGHSKANLPLRFLVLYSVANASTLYNSGGGQFFYQSYFKDLFFPQTQDEQHIKIEHSTLFRIGRPGTDEIGHVLNKRRIEENGLAGLFNIPFEVVCRNLWQDFPLRDEQGRKIIDSETHKTRQLQTVTEMMHPALPKRILELSLQKLNDEGGWKKLDSLIGMDEIKNKFRAYIKAFHDFKEGRSRTFNPHIALTGNPGTGKTTVARIIGEILREEGLLTHGHFVETSRPDLVGQYVGETSIKTSEVCQQARGGVLFVDEAYLLCDEDQQGGSGPDYGRESIGAMLPFMTSEGKDYVFIFAGYPDKIDYFLKHGNPGLSRRVPYVWNIEDYKPDVLYQIARNAMGDMVVTEEFHTALRMLLAYKYGMRSPKNWGNAGEVENIVQKIKTNYTEQGNDGPMDVECIPEEYMRHIKDISTEEELAIMHDLDELIGLGEVKKQLRELITKVKSDRNMMRLTNCIAPAEENMNYIFSGNPGTGKTTVAKMIGRILHGFGILESPEVIEADVSRINEGNPSHNIMEFFDKAVGKVLFIDEAYSLMNSGHTMAVDAMTKALTDENYMGKMCVILAGYPTEMTRLIKSNVGMTRRFPNKIHFDDYTNEELWKILKQMAVHHQPIPLTLAEDCHPYAIDYFSRISREEFSNAGEAKNLLDKLYRKMSARVLEQHLTELTILPKDFDTFGKIDPTQVKIDDGNSQRPPFEQLDSLQGIDQIKKQFENYIEKLEFSINHPQSPRFRPHMAFLGNPGTGKTTVARIFGDILKEKNILQNGKFIETTAKDFIAGHIGGTQEKALAKCEEARGGVMFIDEAHQLYQREDEHGYAKEALGVILTELESRKDTLYIFAGYSREMNEFLDKADAGLRSRIPNIFEFEDYSPSTLTTIIRSKFKGLVTTADFDKWLELAIENLYNMRNPFTFANAREMDTMAVEILDMYRELHGRRGPLDVDCIPESYLACLREMSPEREEELRRELNRMIGLDNVKDTLWKITNKAKGQRKKIKRGVPGIRPANLTFLFMGNPGTGKTTVAQLLGKILHGYGLLSSDEVKIYTKDKIVDKYVGGTLKNVTKMFDESFGRVLFIDEAYMLSNDKWGMEALDQITAKMTDPNYKGKMAIVMAGYTNEINQMLNSNSGLSSRFNYKIMFNDYTNEQLWLILESGLRKQNLIIRKDECKPYADAYFNLKRQSSKNFGNVRECVNLQDEVVANQDNRIGNAPDDVDDEYLLTVLPEDFPYYAEIKKLLDLKKENQTSKNEVPPTQDSDEPSNDISIDCAANDYKKRVAKIKDIESAVGLLHSSHGEGTAFIVSLAQKYILTCSHVIENVPPGDTLEFKLSSGNFNTPAHPLWNNYSCDMALLVLEDIPEDARYLELDSNVDRDPVKLTKVIMCGYPDGSEFASGVSLVESSINNYEKSRCWNDRQYDTIYSNLSATHGCSGGPVVRQEDMTVVGLLQGGKEGGEIQLITDIHQLFKSIKIKS